MKARDIMSKTVRTVTPTTPVQKIAKLLVSRRISAVPVVDKRRHVIGIVSESDLLRRAEMGTQVRRSRWADLFTDPSTRASEYIKSRGRLARDVMTRSVICATMSTDLSEIARLMEKFPIKRVPIVKGGKLVGIVSRSDMVRTLSRAKPPGRVKLSDADLRQRIQDEIDSKDWISKSLVNFVVDKGKVELFGLVSGADQRAAMGVLAENVPGVRSVSNQLSLMPRTMGYV
jgi:CBS-domain-containing membrane protein